MLCLFSKATCGSSVQRLGFAIRCPANTPSCGPRFAVGGSAATLSHDKRGNMMHSYRILYAIIRGPIWQEQPIYETKPISHLLSMRARGVLRDRFLSTNCSRVQRRSGIDEARRKSGRHLLSSQERSEDDGRIPNPEDEGRESPAANTGGWKGSGSCSAAHLLASVDLCPESHLDVKWCTVTSSPM